MNNLLNIIVVVNTIILLYNYTDTNTSSLYYVVSPILLFSISFGITHICYYSLLLLILSLLCIEA